jgi:hypothetical protein
MVLVIHVFLDNFHNTAALPIVKIYPLVDFESLVSDIQFTSLYILVPLGIQYNICHNRRYTSNI